MDRLMGGDGRFVLGDPMLRHRLFLPEGAVNLLCNLGGRGVF